MIKKGKGLLKVIEEDGIQSSYTYKDLPSDKEMKDIIEKCYEKITKKDKGDDWVVYPYRK